MNVEDPNIQANPTIEDDNNSYSYPHFHSDSENEQVVPNKPKRRATRLSDSESDTPFKQHDYDSDSHSDINQPSESVHKKSRLKINNDNDDDDSKDSIINADIPEEIHNDQIKSARIKEKQKKIIDKFKNTILKSKSPKITDEINDNYNVVNPSPTDDDTSFIKSKISQLCDSESSSEDYDKINEGNLKTTEKLSPPLKKTLIKKTKSPKRMSAKQAMEQMQKIKSESNRMLREKDVYLPYHRPKPISLKDILAKKNIQFVTGIQKLTLRMNEDQLKNYAIQLEKRKKSILELYESDSESCEENDNTEDLTILQPDVSREKMSGILTVENPTNERTQIDNQHNLALLQENVNDENNVNNETCEMTINSEVLKSDNALNILSEDNIENKIIEEKTTILPENLTILDKSKEENFKNTLEFHSINNLNNDIENKYCDESAIQNNLKSSDSNLIENNINDYHFQNISENAEEKKNSSFVNLKKQLYDQLSSNLSIKPTLKCSDDGFIDLSPNNNAEEIKGINAFKNRCIFNTSLKSPLEIEQDKEKRLLPGSAFMNFRRELEEQICEQRLKEWEKKQEEELLKKREQKLDDELSDCEELLKDETNKYNENLEENIPKAIIETESEEDDDDEEELSECDIIIKKSKKTRFQCDYIDDEAEVDEEDQLEKQYEDDTDDLSHSESDVAEIETFSKKKKLTRILMPTNSDSSDNDDDINYKPDTVVSNEKSEVKINYNVTDPKNSSNLKTIESEDLFYSLETKKNESFSSDDFIPLGQNLPPSDISENDLKINSQLDLNEEQGVPNIQSNIFPEQDFASTTDIGCIEKTPERKVLNNFCMETDSENFENTQYMAELCSGTFPTENSQINTKSISKFDNANVSTSNQYISQDTENELMELCTGKFFGTESSNNQIDTLCSIAKINCEKDVNNALSVNKESSEKNNKNFNTTKLKKQNIKSFFIAQKSKVNDKNSSIEVKPTATNDVERLVEITKPKYCISSSSDNDNENENELNNDKIKKLKSRRDRNKKRKAKPLILSDDESDEEELSEKESNFESDEELDNDEENQIEYDSEENEVEVNVKENIVKSKTKKNSVFFEQEAELTSDDEWKGSGDEDEKDLDEFESEEGDADQLDQNKVVKELERIHRHQMLDQDNKEINLLKDILLEDGDLDGGTRERKFRWKNIDDNIESGAVVNDDQDNAFEDDQNEEQWRRQRYERETFLKELKNKSEQQNSEIDFDSPLANKISTAKNVLKLAARQNLTENILIENIENTNESNKHNDSNKNYRKINDVPSPVKKPLLMIQRNFKGSFLSKSQAALDRLAALTKTFANGEEPSINVSSLAPGKKKNFVFTTVSPPCNNLPENVKLAKRKMMSDSLEAIPGCSKKAKISHNTLFGKSLLDHME